MWNPNAPMPLRWAQISAHLKTRPDGTVFRVNSHQVEHPGDAGLMASIGFPVGQRADFRLDLGDGALFAVQDFGTYYLARLEKRTTAQVLERALQETPGSSVIGMIAAGALIGLALGRSKEGAFAGAAIGGMAALAGVTVANARTSPDTSEAASRLATSLAANRARPKPSSSGRQKGRKGRR